MIHSNNIQLYNLQGSKFLEVAWSFVTHSNGIRDCASPLASASAAACSRDEAACESFKRRFPKSEDFTITITTKEEGPY